MPEDDDAGRPSPFRPFPFSPFRPPQFSQPLEGLIVLGARLNPQDQPGRVAQVRLTHALNLWRQGRGGGYVLLTGGVMPGCGCSEARAMADWALTWAAGRWGEEVREALHACLVLEEASRSTAASARHTLPLVEARGSRCVGLVTDTFHIHRATFIFKRRFAPVGVTIIPLVARGLGRHYWQRRRYLRLTRMALREGGAWVKALGRLLLERRGPR
jgi:uncharacterized SAM-binding protein YcdF (DUF218 family)